VYEQIKNYERLGSSGFRSRVFDDNADGTAGYQIYVIDVDSITGKAKYKKVFLIVNLVVFHFSRLWPDILQCCIYLQMYDKV
jgi:hypothetical protein